MRGRSTAETKVVAQIVTFAQMMGEELRAIRRKLSLSQSDAAWNAIGVTQSTLSRIENGRADITVAQLRALCELYGEKADAVVRRVERRWHRMDEEGT